MVAAGQSNGKPVMLEGGGKSPQIIFADAIELDGLADSIAAAAFANSGQICVARTCLLVERGNADALVERLRNATARDFTQGEPLEQDRAEGMRVRNEWGRYGASMCEE